MSRGAPVVAETIRGKPVPVLDRSITPVVRTISYARHNATIRRKRVEGEAWGVMLARPVAIVEERFGQARVLNVPDVTRRILTSMVLVAALVPLLSMVLVRVNLWMRDR